MRSLLVWVADDVAPSQPSELFVQKWAAKGFSAVAVLPRRTNPDRVLPRELRRGHVVFWSHGIAEAAHEVLAAAAVVPMENRVFISYRHGENEPLAHELFHLLSEARFDVFLDRFVLEPGADFAEELEQELLDKTFVLVVESPTVNESKWIRHEISFAIRHRLGLAAVNHNWTTPALGIGEARRFRLRAGDVLPQARSTGGRPSILLPAPAGRIVEFMRQIHARALVQRRETLLSSFEVALSAAGVGPAEMEHAIGGIDVRRGPGYAVDFQVRPPSARSFRTVDERGASMRRTPVLVSPGSISVRRRADLEWISAKGGVRHCDEGRVLELAQLIAAGAL